MGPELADMRELYFEFPGRLSDEPLPGDLRKTLHLYYLPHGSQPMVRDGQK